MKKIFLLTLLFALGSLNAQTSLDQFLLELGSPENIHNYSFEKVEPEFSAEKIHWPLYKQVIGTETLMMRFPRPPRLAKNNGILSVYSNRKKTTYTLVGAMPPVGGIKSKDAFSVAIASLSQYPNRLIEYKITKAKGQHILDTISEDSQTGEITKSRLLITFRNFYILKTQFMPGEREDHEFFIDSFNLEHNDSKS